MNILIPHEWLSEYIQTNANQNEIAKALSLHSFNIEAIQNNDVYEVEVTPNRGDALSVLGISRELMVVLKKMGFSAKWVEKKIQASVNPNPKNKLKVSIKDKELVPRFSAVILDNVQIKDSPEYIKTRLEKAGIRAINNVVDVTNYFMIERGQPMHAFDYDKVAGSEMIVRQSKEGEVITTLDKVDRKLTEGVIVIEDGSGRLIDLCGIMGGLNSEIDNNTKRVILFVQVYDPTKIRKASMSLGHRTDAALRFEKGIDFEGVIPSLWKAVEMLKDIADAQVSSELIDIVNAKQKTKEVKLDYEKVNFIAGVKIEKKQVDEILGGLGFSILNQKVLVPSWRYDDINISEDIAEEVIRIYGYYNLPNILPGGEIPIIETNSTFLYENRIKDLLKDLGFFEFYTTSATTKELAGNNSIALKNPLNEDLSHLKTTLTPHLCKQVNNNKGYSEQIKAFEIAPVYIATQQDLPKQPTMLALAVRGIDEQELKGICEVIFDEFRIKEYPTFKIENYSNVLGIELNFDDLVKNIGPIKQYVPLTSFNSIKEDITLIAHDKTTYQEIVETVRECDKRINSVRFKEIYDTYLTLSLEYLDTQKQISSEDTQQIRSKIFRELETRLEVRLKDKV